jgi:hypothetical protein
METFCRDRQVSVVVGVVVLGAMVEKLVWDPLEQRKKLRSC